MSNFMWGLTPMKLKRMNPEVKNASEAIVAAIQANKEISSTIYSQFPVIERLTEDSIGQHFGDESVDVLSVLADHTTNLHRVAFNFNVTMKECGKDLRATVFGGNLKKINALITKINSNCRITIGMELAIDTMLRGMLRTMLPKVDDDDMKRFIQCFEPNYREFHAKRGISIDAIFNMKPDELVKVAVNPFQEHSGMLLLN